MTSSINKIPEHVGIILDGNRRWAKERNLPRLEGHLKGYEIAKKAPKWFFKKGVKIVSLYSFSTENWNRESSEVNYLMNLLARAIVEEANEAVKEGRKILISGRLDELPDDLGEKCREVMSKTTNGKNGTINICINYGGRAEIIDAIKKIINQNKVQTENINETIVNQHLYHNLPDPEIIIRTSGEKRLSGFLLWQSAYSELIFLKKYWPEFEKSDVEKVLKKYEKRNRRFGGN